LQPPLETIKLTPEVQLQQRDPRKLANASLGTLGARELIARATSTNNQSYRYGLFYKIFQVRIRIHGPQLTTGYYSANELKFMAKAQ
jgi:hypothetical protein